jgi:DNA polymerase V
MTTRKYPPLSRKGVGGRHKGPPTAVVRIPLPIANLARRLTDGTLRAGDINGFIDIEARTSLTVPLVGSSAACDFPSPADDHLDRPLDFNELLVQNPAATFAVRIVGESMTGAGLFPGDIAVVDRSLKPVGGCIVLALIDGEFTIKRYRQTGGTIVLEAESPAFQAITLSEEIGLEVWGVLRHAIRML